MGGLESLLRRKGHEGLAQSIQKISTELTLLGFVSLVLLLFQEFVSMSSMCIGYDQNAVTWTLMDNIGPNCPCCIANTEGISACAEMYHDCAYNNATGEPFCGCQEGKPMDTTESTYRPGGGEPPVCVPYGITELQFIATTKEALWQQYLAPVEAASSGRRRKDRRLQSFSTSTGSSKTSRSSRRRETRRALRQDPSSNISSSEAAAAGAPYSSIINATRHIVPALSTFSCMGPFFSEECPEGQHPLISSYALDQIHILVFLTALLHVLASIAVVVTSILRMRQWKRWQEEESKLGALSTTLSSLTHITGVTVDGDVSGGGGRGGQSTAEMLRNQSQDLSGMGDVAGDKLSRPPSMSQRPPSVDRNNSNQSVEEEKGDGGGGDDAKEGVVGVGGGGTPPVMVENDQASMDAYTANFESASKDYSARGAAAKAAAAQAAKPVTMSVRAAGRIIHKYWHRRDTMLIRNHSRFLEALICIGQTFLPNLVTKEQFLIMRSSYITTLQLPQDFDFVQECSLRLEFDLNHIIGSSVTMWFILIAQWLFSGLWPSTTILIFLLVAIKMLVLNIGLIYTIRYACRGGRPHRVRTTRQWWRSAKFLAIPIGGTIFFVSTIYSSILFFLWQFGPNSCFFESGAPIWKWMPSAFPWWTSLIFSTFMLFWLSYVTVPAWVLVSHMRPHYTWSRMEEQQTGSGDSPMDMVVGGGGGGSGGGGQRPEAQMTAKRSERRLVHILSDMVKLQEELKMAQELE